MIRSVPNRRILPLGIALCTAVLLAACVQARGPLLTSDAASYQPVRIASGVASRPGALAWSPDGSQLAFIDGTVAVLDATGPFAALRRIDIPFPRYLAWADDGTLYALSRTKDRDVLYLVDAAHPGMTRVELDRRADAVYPIGRRKTLLLSLQTVRLKIGTEVSCTLSRVDVAGGGTATTLHAYRRIFPTTDQEEEFLTAWLQAGPNPLDGSFLIMEHIKPPALPPYTLVRAFDPVSGDLEEVGGGDRRTIYASASWSPDGRRLALTAREGRLVIRRSGGTLSLENPVAGLYPVWHPAGDLLIVGGTLVNASTGQSVPLLRNGSGSYARWSPEGERLALVARGELLLLTNFPPSAASPMPLDSLLKKKLTMLQELLQDGLITAEDYRERKSLLLQNKEEGP